MLCHRISPLRPAADETLMSFLGRAQVDADCTDERLHLLIAGVHLHDARAAERRPYDWESLSRFFNASAEELFHLSERSWLFGSGSENPRLSGPAPWTRQTGYGAHCSCCLKESGHWRRAWLKPDALVCVRHDALLVRHCPCCETDLTELKWTRALPLCPGCGGPLSLGERVPAPQSILVEARKWTDDFKRILEDGPVVKNDGRIAHWAAVWRASQILFKSSNPTLLELAQTLVGLSGLGDFKRSGIVAEQALQFTQLFLALHRLDELQRATTEHYWLVMNNRVSGSELDTVILHQLAYLAESFGITFSFEFKCQAVLSSRASEAGWNLLPIAA